MSVAIEEEIDTPGPGLTLEPDLEDLPPEHGHHPGSLPAKALIALGVVFGDIGTSPLYAFRESFHQSQNLAVNSANVLGVLSLIAWSLLLVICVKYLLVVLRAHHGGEGGILVLTGLACRKRKAPGLVFLGLFGTCLLYGDGVLTPAISVLSAVEGLSIATPLFEPYVVPITVGILVALFWFQRGGTGRVGRVFGPVTALWFGTLALLGGVELVSNPAVLRAFNPYYAVQFFRLHGLSALWVVGAVFLVVTGGEALYADLGHLGAKPIRAAWFVLVLPSLLINYFGQGALLLRSPEALESPFYRLVPEWGLYPAVVLATAATIIASQALISGVFSLGMQSIQMGYLPRMRVLHTSETEYGQVYVPALNWLLLAGCVGVVLGFGSSSNIAAAYGVAVAATMVITTLLLHELGRSRWGWSPAKAHMICGAFLCLDLLYLAGNAKKMPQGGWFPILVASLVYLLMTTWRRGGQAIAESRKRNRFSWEQFIDEMLGQELHRVPGVSVFLTGNAEQPPNALLNYLEFNQALHEHVIVLSVKTTSQPYLRGQKRLEIEELTPDLHRVLAYFGYLEKHELPPLLMRAQERLGYNPSQAIYVVGSEEGLFARSGWPHWRRTLLTFLGRNRQPITSFLSLPQQRILKLGTFVPLNAPK